MKKKYRVIKWRKTLPRSKIISYFDNIQLLIPMLRRVLSKSNNKYFSFIKISSGFNLCWGGYCQKQSRNRLYFHEQQNIKSTYVEDGIVKQKLQEEKNVRKYDIF